MSDLLRTLAFAFRRKGEAVMPGNGLRLMLAFDLNWFAPADAKRLVDRALAGGLLVAEGEDVRLVFDPAAVEVPVGFKPTTAVLEEPFPDVPAAPAPKPKRSDAEAEAERARWHGWLSLDVARLVVRRRAGEDVSSDLAAAEQGLFKSVGR